MEMLTAIQKRRDRSTEAHAFRACINCVFMEPGYSRLASQLHALFGPKSASAVGIRKLTHFNSFLPRPANAPAGWSGELRRWFTSLKTPP